MIKRNTKRRLIKTVFYSSLGLVVVVIAAQLVTSLYLKPLLGRQLEKLVADGSDGLYCIHYTGIGINIWTGSVHVEGVTLHTDSARFSRLAEEKDLPALTLDLKVAELRITRFRWVRFLWQRDIRVSQIHAKNADINLYRHLARHKVDTVIAKDTLQPVWKLIQPDVKSIFVKDVIFENSHLAYHDSDTGSTFRWQFDRFDTHLSDIQIDSASSLDTQRLLYASNMEVDIQKINLFTADSLYRLYMGHVSYSLLGRAVIVDSLLLEPTVSYAEFYRRTRMEKDIYTVRMPAIRLAGFKPEQFITQNIFEIDSLVLANGNLSIYHDRIPPDDTVSKLGKFPHQLLLKSPFGMHIHTAICTHMAIRYTERSDETLREGTFYFTGIEGLATHITNLPDEIRKNPESMATVKGVFMNTTHINGKLFFDLSRTDGTFRAEATMSATDVRVLNSVTEPLGSVRFKSLLTGPIYYSVQGNEFGAYGYLKMPYSQLNMQVLHVAHADEKARRKTFMTWMIKNFSYNENPLKDEPLRIAENVYHPRNVHRSFFNLIWRTMYTCAKDIGTRESGKKMLKKRKERLQKQDQKKQAGTTRKN